MPKNNKFYDNNTSDDDNVSECPTEDQCADMGCHEPRNSIECGDCGEQYCDTHIDKCSCGKSYLCTTGCASICDSCSTTLCEECTFITCKHYEDYSYCRNCARRVRWSNNCSSCRNDKLRAKTDAAMVLIVQRIVAYVATKYGKTLGKWTKLHCPWDHIKEEVWAMFDEEQDEPRIVTYWYHIYTDQMDTAVKKFLSKKGRRLSMLNTEFLDNCSEWCVDKILFHTDIAY